MISWIPRLCFNDDCKLISFFFRDIIIFSQFLFFLFAAAACAQLYKKSDYINMKTNYCFQYLIE